MSKAGGAGIVGLVALAAVAACDGVSRADREVVRAWLTCATCDNGERAAVEALGPDVVALLTQPLDTSSKGGRRLVRGLEASVWGSYATIAALPGAPDSATYMRQFLGNALAGIQSRAAVSLGDLRAADEIQKALDERTERGLRDDVADALETSLLRARGGIATTVDSVVVVPGAVELAVGDTMVLSYLALDATGRPVPAESVTWALAPGPSAAVTVGAAGHVTALAPGVGTVTATHAASGSVGRGVVTVVVPTPVPSLSVVSGHRQAGVVGTPLSDPVVIQGRNPDGSVAAGIRVAWSVESGGGVLTRAESFTRPDGTARARWLLGGLVGMQRLSVTGPNNLPLLIRARGLEYSGPLRIRGVVLVDGAGQSGATVTLSSGASTTTESDGEFVFSGVGAGTYSVIVSDLRPPLTRIVRQATVTAAAPVAVVTCAATLHPGTISGGLFVDDNPRNNRWDGAPAEDHLTVANVTIELVEPGGIVTTDSTNANGEFSFPGLGPGRYVVRLADPADPALPPTVHFGGRSTSVIVAVTPGRVSKVYFPFDPF